MDDDDGYRGIKLDQPDVVPDISLTDTEGRPFDLAEQPRRALVFFGYTHCPDICQIVMSTIAGLTKMSKADRSEVQFVFVTTDPARDTGDRLRTYLDRFKPRFLGASGSLKDIYAVGSPMGIDVMKGRKLPSGSHQVSHNTNVISVGGGRATWSGRPAPHPPTSPTTSRRY